MADFPLKILIHGINFSPELTGIGKYSGEMAEWLAERGHEVRVVTAPPYYPEWRVGTGYSAIKYKVQGTRFKVQGARGKVQGTRFKGQGTRFKVQGVRYKVQGARFKGQGARYKVQGARYKVQGTRCKGQGVRGMVQDASDEGAGVAPCDLSRASVVIYRCPLWVPARPSGAKRLLHLASFALSSLPVMLRQIFWKPDVVMVIEPPLMCAPASVLVARLCGARSWLHIQDFEVDAAFDMGILPPGRLRNWVLRVERVLMRAFDCVSTISPKMLARVVEKGVDPARAVLFPNWVDTEMIHPLDGVSALRTELGIAADCIVALYSGNMGEKQGLEVVLEAAQRMQDTRGKVQGARYKVQGARCKVQGARCKVQGTRRKGKEARGKRQGKRRKSNGTGGA